MSQPLAVRFHFQGSFLFWMLIFKAFCWSLLPSAHHNSSFLFFRPDFLYFFIDSLVSSCLYCRDVWTTTFFMFVQSSCTKKKKVWRERDKEWERTCTQNGEDRIVKIKELVYNRYMLQFRPPPPPQTYVCIQFSVQAKSKTEQCQCTFKYHSST